MLNEVDSLLLCISEIKMDVQLFVLKYFINSYNACLISGSGSAINSIVLMLSTSNLFGLKLLMIVFPIIALSIAVIAFYFYPLHGERLEKVREEQKKLHEQKKANV